MRVFCTFRKCVVAAALTLAPLASFADVYISVGIAPPMLPVYTQPICPNEGYLWTPGYWAYGEDGYFWVPGVWVQPPMVGYLWTPAYWGWGGNAYLFHPGYWGPHVGFYGGVNYGFGYIGNGYEGGYWDRGRFSYNRAVNNINVTNIHNTYNKTVIVNNSNVAYNRVSYNGGNGGIAARASAQELVAEREQHVPPTQNQIQHRDFAAQNRQQFANVNGGRPAIAAQARVGDRTNIVPARGAVNAREANQQQRIGNGVASGQMTAGEAARAETRQGNVNRHVQIDRQANGGTLTPGERQQVQREQNGANRQIYNENHNAQVQSRVQPQPQGQVQPRVQPQPQVQQRVEPQSQPRVQPQPQVQQRVQPQMRQEAPRPQSEPRSDARGDPRGDSGRGR